jgi:hypothetical protein
LADGDSDDGPDLERPGEVDLADDELLEKAMAAAGGGKFARLWAGDTSMHDGDHSRADLAMLCKLAFWTGGDRARMEQLFNRSGLARDKWRDRPDYRERSIDAALEQTTDYYEPAGVNPSDPIPTANRIREWRPRKQPGPPGMAKTTTMAGAVSPGARSKTCSKATLTAPRREATRWPPRSSVGTTIS